MNFNNLNVAKTCRNETNLLYFDELHLMFETAELDDLTGDEI